MIILRILALIVFLFSGFTAIKPKSGGAGLAYLSPNFFSGSFIFIIAILGLCSAFFSWLVTKVLFYRREICCIH